MKKRQELITLRIVHNPEEETAAKAQGWSGNYEALPANRKEQLEWLDRELKELARLKKEGKLVPDVDMGGFDPFSFVVAMDAIFQAKDSEWGPV